MPVVAFTEAASRIQGQTATSEAEHARELLLYHAAATTASPTTTSGSTTSLTQTAESADTSMTVTSETDLNTAGQVQNTSATEPTIQSIFAPYMTQSDTDMTNAEDSTESDIITADISAPASNVSELTTPRNITTVLTSFLDSERSLVAIERAVNANLQSQISSMAQQAIQTEEKHDMETRDMNYLIGRAADLERTDREKTLSINELQTKIKKLESQIEENGEIIDKLALAGRQADNAITRHKDEVSDLTHDLSESQTTVQAQALFHQETVAALTEEALAKVASLEQQVSDLQRGLIQHTDAEKDQLLARNQELVSQLASHTNEFAQLSNRAEARVQEDHEKIIFLEQQHNEALKQLETIASDLTKSRNEHSALQTEHDGLIQQYGEVHRSREQQAEQIVVQQRLNSEALARTAAVEADSEALRAQVANLEQGLLKARSGGEGSMLAYEDAVGHIRNLESKISEYEQQEQVWLARNRDLESNQEQFEEALKAASDLTEHPERIEDLKEYYKEKMGALERANASKDTRISKLEAKLAANDEENRPSSSHTYVSRNLSPVHGLGFASLDAELQGFSLLMSPNRQHFAHSQDDMLSQRSHPRVQELDFSEISTVVDQEPVETPATTTLPTRQTLSFSDTIIVAVEEPVEPTVSTALPIRQRLGFSGTSTLLDEEPVEPQVEVVTAPRSRQQLALSGTSTLLDEEPIEPQVEVRTVSRPRQQLSLSGTSTLLNEEPVEPQVVVRTVSRPRQELGLSITSTVLNEEPIDQQSITVSRPRHQLGFRQPRTVLDISPSAAERLAGSSSPEGFGITPAKEKPMGHSPPQAIRQRLSFATPQTIISEASVDTVLPQPQILPGLVVINRARSPVGRFADKYCPSFVFPALLILLFLWMTWNWFTTSAEHASWHRSNELARSSVVQQRADGAGIIFAYGPAQWLVALVRAIAVFCWTFPTPMSGGAIQGKMFGLAAEVGYDSSLVY